MKVILVQPYGDRPGHFSPDTRALAEALTSEGAEVHLVSASGFREDWPAELSLPHDAALVASRFAKIAQGAPFRRLWQSLLVERHAFALAAEDFGSIVHFLDYEPLTMALLNVWHGRPRHVINLGGIPRFAVGSSGQGVRFVYHRMIWERSIASLTRNMTTILHSHAVSTLAKRAGLLSGAPTSVIPYGIATRTVEGSRAWARQALGVPPASCLVLFFGQQRKQKGLDFLVEAIAQLPRGAVHVLVAGEKDPSGFDSKTLAQQAGCFSDFSFHEQYIPEADVDTFFAAADCLILPYRRDFQFASGVLARACGYALPILASSCGEVGHTVRAERLGFVFEPENAQAMANAIRLFANLAPTQRALIQTHVRAYASCRSWQMAARAHLAVYRQVLNGGTPGREWPPAGRQPRCRSTTLEATCSSLRDGSSPSGKEIVDDRWAR